MNLTATTSAETIERGLQSQGMELARGSGERWTLKFKNGGGRRLEVRRIQSWLQFTTPDQATTVASPSNKILDAVNRNVGSPAGIKLALNPSRQLELQLDLFLAEEMDVEKRVRAVVNSFQHVRKDRSSAVSQHATECPEDLEQLCEEAGWSGVRRSSGRLTVALDCTPARQATVTHENDGVRLQIEVADLGAEPSPSRWAAAALALEISSATRLVRAVADPDSAKLGFEILWSDIPCATELDAGLGALSAAARVAGDSFTALQNEKLADDYLTVRGWSADLTKPATKQKQNKKG